ncbi:hypothetical protein GLOIN_2v1737263 [Rhizophagus clarus]|uniref:Uncharacterized protein n=1 Tax=Rhizophagus clarus TaxID=94130 RepID=A0A8H3QJC8_9GLOM|nr:hypothetical protein GLOIN_2v1737263 [Rhizophagus clarus]
MELLKLFKNTGELDRADSQNDEDDEDDEFAENVHIITPTTDSDDDEQGYIPEDTLFNLSEKATNKCWLFLMGTSGSGKPRSLYELLCKKYGIYFLLNIVNGSNNLGSKDKDITMIDLGFKLVPNEPQENNNIALRYTRAILLSRLFILTKLLEFHIDNKFINITPNNQLLSLQIYDKDDFCFVPGQKKLPIVTDESQTTIRKYKNIFPPTDLNNQTLLFFVILLQTALHLSTMKLCLILLGTGMSFEDIKNFASSSIAKPSDDESMKSIFNIFWGRRRFLVQFLEKSLLSSMSRDVNGNVEQWQDDAMDFIFSTFNEDCFSKLRDKKEVWDKVMDIVTPSMFSNSKKTVRGGGVIEMVQYGFAQLCDYKLLASDRDIFQEDVIELYLSIVLERLFNEKICKEHHLFTDIKNIDKIKLLSFKSAIPIQREIFINYVFLRPFPLPFLFLKVLINIAAH